MHRHATAVGSETQRWTAAVDVATKIDAAETSGREHGKICAEAAAARAVSIEQEGCVFWQRQRDIAARGLQIAITSKTLQLDVSQARFTATVSTRANA